MSWFYCLSPVPAIPASPPASVDLSIPCLERYPLWKIMMVHKKPADLTLQCALSFKIQPCNFDTEYSRVVFIITNLTGQTHERTMAKCKRCSHMYDSGTEFLALYMILSEETRTGLQPLTSHLVLRLWWIWHNVQLFAGVRTSLQIHGAWGTTVHETVAGYGCSSRAFMVSFLVIQSWNDSLYSSGRAHEVGCVSVSDSWGTSALTT